MKNKVQLSALAGLVVVLVLVWGGNLRSPDSFVGAVPGAEKVERFVVPNPSLRLDLLKKISSGVYEGMQRNIFRSTPLPVAPQKPVGPAKPVDTGPAIPIQPVDPPVVPPFKFYGYVVDARSGRRRGFFTNGDDIWVAAEGEPIQRRFKLVRLTASQAEVEEISSGKRATLPLDETAAPSTTN